MTRAPAQEEPVESTTQDAEEGIPLIDGERVDSTLNLGTDPENSNGQEVIVLTDRRVIRFEGGGKYPRYAIASLDEIDVVELAVERRGFAAYIWAGLAFVIAAVLYGMIDNTLGAITVSLLVALMGVYLIVDHLLTPGTPTVTFKTPSSEIRCVLAGDEPDPEVHVFINRLFQLQGRRQGQGRFAPR